MIKCNITACGTIGRDASMRTTKEEKTFLTFPLRVVLQGKDGRNETVEISVSKEGGQKKVSGYRNGLRVEVAGTLFLKRRGEKLYISPYKNRADIVFDSSLPYEVSVMKHYALPILHSIPQENERHDEILQLVDAFQYFEAIDPALVAKDSLLREFIGAGSYQYR